jgi:hypothetical protein
VPATELRGVSILQLRRLSAAAKALCVRERWTSTDPSRAGKVLAPEDMTLYDLAQYVIRPSTRGGVAGDGAEPCSLMELVSRGAQPPSWFVR